MAVVRATRAGSAEDPIALIKQVQPVVSGLGTIVVGAGAILGLVGALSTFS
ncbi:hypothetical protein ACFYVR_08955 [Rhodococcus sp. NPDC003318]|uniref:hypothetical protein n=1 Tax=Rhodococcus sp. NPDC003318 TaxID=3364503 RepID=UPI00367B36E3